jgi:P27 family predicted phage terminase small subunit
MARSRGRRPKPSAIKKAAGNPGKRKLNAREPRPVIGIPECPPHLDAVARQEWDRVAPLLIRVGCITPLDRAALVCYCQAWSRLVDAEQNLIKFGKVVKTPRGYPVQNPYLSISNAAMSTIERFATEFGMTPSSRSRINAGVDPLPPGSPAKPGSKQDEWAQFDQPTSLKVQ